MCLTVRLKRLSGPGKPEDRHVSLAERRGNGLAAVMVLERPQELPVEKAALDAGQRALPDAPRELVGEILGQGVMPAGVLAADRLGDEIRLPPMPLVEGNGDL